MKSLLFVFVVLVTSVSCRKDQDQITPNITGIYQINSLYNMNGETLTYPTLASDGKVAITSELEITKIDEYEINITRKGVAQGTPYTDPLGRFDIQQNGSQYTIYKNGLFSGNIDSDKVYLSLAGRSNNTMISSIRASR
jgi:hypothetical protein